MRAAEDKASDISGLVAEDGSDTGSSSSEGNKTPPTESPAPHENADPAAPHAEGGSGWMLYTGLLGATLAGLLYLRSRPQARQGAGPRKRESRNASTPAPKYEPMRHPAAAPPAVLRPVEPVAEAEALSVTDFHENVAQLLIAVLEREPARSDLRWKLLEAYYFGGQAAPFIEHAQEYKRHRRGDHDEHWDSIVGMGRFLAPDCPLFSCGEPDQRTVAAESAATATTAAVPKNRRFHEAIAPQRLRPALDQLSAAYAGLRRDPAFRQALAEECRHVLGRPTPFTPLAQIEKSPGLELFLKREDHRGANDYRLQNALGQVLLAKKLGARRVVAGTLSGQHGIAVATAASRRGMACTIHVSGKVAANQEIVGRLRELGAEIQSPRMMLSVATAEPRQAAMMDWIDSEQSSFFVSGLSGGVAPYPNIVFDLMAVIGDEAAAQLRDKTATPLRLLVACGIGGMETFGFISPFLNDPKIEIFLIDPPLADTAHSPLRREYKWLSASSRVRHLKVTESMAQAALRTAASMQSLKLDPADGFTLAGALAIASRASGNGSMVALMGFHAP